MRALLAAVRSGTRNVVALPPPWDLMPAAGQLESRDNCRRIESTEHQGTTVGQRDFRVSERSYCNVERRKDSP